MSFSLTALSGLRTANKGLEIASNNIANAQTSGFKASRANNVDISLGGNNSAGMGSYVGSLTQNFSQGTVTQTGRDTDLSINGEGFFILKDKSSNSNLYTRDGNFNVNKDGTIVDSGGNSLLAYNKQNGILNNSLSEINVKLFDKTPKQTENIKYDINLNGQDSVANSIDSKGNDLNKTNLENLTYKDSPNFSTSKSIYDSLGGEHRLTTNFYKQGSSSNPETTQWYAQTILEDYNVETNSWKPSGSLNQNSIPTAQVTGITFDDKGKLLSYDPTGNSFNANIASNGANVKQEWFIAQKNANSAGITQSINIDNDISKLTQYSGSYNIREINQDGYNLGAFDKISISENGTISANYTNGVSHEIAKIPLANFTNTQGLENVGDNDWRETYSSGSPQISDAQTNGLGSINSGSLENSNVDIANETINMIFLQQMYMANSKAIQVDKENTDAILNLV